MNPEVARIRWGLLPDTVECLDIAQGFEHAFRSVTWNFSKEIFEVRFPKAVSFWDTAGRISTLICKTFPALEIESGSPEAVKFVGKEKGIVLTVGLDRANVHGDIQHFSEGYFTDVCTKTVGLITHEMEVTTFSRVGNRLMYELPTDSDDRSKKIIARIGSGMSLIEAVTVKSDEERMRTKQLEELFFRVTDAKLGIMCHLKPIVTQFQIDKAALAVMAQKLPPPEFSIMLDIDVYTNQPVAKDFLVVDQLLRSNQKLVETRILTLFNP